MTELPSDLLSLAKDVLVAAKSNASKITTAESCTGGALAAALTSIPGASEAIP